MVSHTCKPRTLAAEAERSEIQSRPGLSGLHSKFEVSLALMNLIKKKNRARELPEWLEVLADALFLPPRVLGTAWFTVHMK